MRIFVEVSGGVDAAAWQRDHAAGQAADATPYGLHYLEDFGHRVLFNQILSSERCRLFARRVQSRLSGLDVIQEMASLVTTPRKSADVILCMDERMGIPAALANSHVPVVTGVAWLENSADVPTWYAAVARRALRSAAGIFVECRAMIDPLCEQFGVPQGKVHFISLGIDAEHFSPSWAPSASGRVFSVGDDRMRDYDTLTNALRMLKDTSPAVSAEVATTMPVMFPDWVQVHRRRMDHAVRECYTRSSVVALALKTTAQGSGLTVILEAMASGRPVVVTANPGLDDYVVHGETGLFVPPGDPHAMSQALKRLLDNPEEAARMGAAGRRRVEERFTSRHLSQQLDGLLRQVA